METSTTTTRTRARIITGRQYLWWHRIRRLGHAGFVLLGGGILSPFVTCALVVAASIGFGFSVAPLVPVVATVWIVTLPVYIGAWAWTWAHMEHRYRATLESNCPWCGYSRQGMSEQAPCPECGRSGDRDPVTGPAEDREER